jgi:hypothetical protein
MDDTLVRVFQAYASFGDRKNTQLLSDFKFLKLAREAGISVHCPPRLRKALSLARRRYCCSAPRPHATVSPLSCMQKRLLCSGSLVLNVCVSFVGFWCRVRTFPST